ncbi:hypothetical protein GYMLUDRAFT_58014 [Collybiopsis luxurians FD-317 M1]|uniref:Uncharacterized protein n=1 Tax=Collybiopsis luxurians FD-317 M1 TaxID=944289 RepID=A0A0D0CTH1_9AGAR|nr:hypothetical protein GYMLUDRAFT_58014 [Collybiopsis luxurians FD-317 M1]
MSQCKLTGLAILGNGQVIEGKSLLFVANFFVASGESIVAALCYFNLDDQQFPAMGKYELHADVVKMPERVAINEDIILEDTEYNLLGDIVWLHAVDIEDPKQCPYIDVIGKAENVVKQDAEFDINPEQYSRLLGGCGTLPIHAIIPNSPKYKAKKDGSSTKPIPKQNLAVAASGFITWVISKADNPDECPNQFCLSVDSVTFLGHSSTSRALPESTTQVCTERGKCKNLFDFDANKASDAIEIYADNPHSEKHEKLSNGSGIPTSGENAENTVTTSAAIPSPVPMAWVSASTPIQRHASLQPGHLWPPVHFGHFIGAFFFGTGVGFLVSFSTQLLARALSVIQTLEDVGEDVWGLATAEVPDGMAKPELEIGRGDCVGMRG